MTLEQIEVLIRNTDFSRLGTVEYEEDGCRLRLISDAASASGAWNAGPVRRTVAPDFIRASSAGIFHASHPMYGRPVAPDGTRTKKGQIVGFLKVGPTLRPVTAEDGVILACLIEDGTIAGFGTPLFRFRRS